MKESTESTEHLLADDGEPARADSYRRGLMGSRITTTASLLSLLLLSYISIVLTVDLATRQTFVDPDLPYSPANPFIMYERKKLWGGRTKYMGPPSPEVDLAWKELLMGLNLRGTKEELVLEGANQTNIVQLVDKDYPVVPLVYHHVHCLDSFRKYHYIDYYRAHAGPDYDTTVTEEHFEHCLETLRKQVLCHADLAMLSGEWVGPSDEKDHIELRTNSESKCVNWEAVHSWALSRHLEQNKFDIIAGPFEKQRHGDDDR